MDDLSLAIFVSLVLVRAHFKLVSMTPMVLLVVLMVRSHTHSAHMPVKPQCLIRICVVIGAKERLADDFVHLGLISVVSAFILGWSDALHFLGRVKAFLFGAGDAGFEAII